MTTIVRQMTLSDADEVNLFLRDHFYGSEPTLQTPGDHQRVVSEPDLNEYHTSQITQGTSLVAVNGERIVGIVLANALLPAEVEQAWIDINKTKCQTLLKHVHRFLSGIERNAHVFEHYGVERALYLHIVAVDSSMRNHGLGRRLVGELINVGRNMGFPIMFSTCTSFFSKRLMSALGMECVHTEAYADYKDDDGNVVIQPPAPHTDASVMAIRL
ncbi:dopamine N-acetyltransferase [Drosophila busckii]|uniref:dopamine N-acetyltransferase n=1 Tax=Drosophila busckii TaxID=30019 RepID=UPI00143346CB|nr:dopamine N-acetyltransferase [Drosophila busckii]